MVFHSFQKLQFIFIICLLFCMNSNSNGYKILVLAPFPGVSHWGMIQEIINGLLDHGHEVTVIAGIKNKRELSQINKNYTEVLIDPIIDFEKYGELQFYPYTKNSLFVSKQNLKNFFSL